MLEFTPGSLFESANSQSALGGSRTHNHLIRSQALYPLSYEGVRDCVAHSSMARQTRQSR
jgi:hypothetical protein